MLDQRTRLALHRLAQQGLSVRKIAQTLGRSRPTTSTSLDDPTPPRPRRPRPRQLEPFHEALTRMLESDPQVSAVGLRQRLAEQGCTGGRTSVRQYRTSVRAAAAPQRPCIRFASAPGEQCQSDWGHCGAMASGATAPTLSCLAVLECPSRLLYLEFTHSQRQDTRHRCLLKALHVFQGPPTALVPDTRRTAGLARQGPLVRFNEHVLAFLRPVHLTPLACHVAQPQEKGKGETGAMHSIRHHCWPLRTCRALPDLQAPANQGRAQGAHVRVHAPPGEPPSQRFAPTAMRP